MNMVKAKCIKNEQSGNPDASNPTADIIKIQPAEFHDLKIHW